MNRDKIILIVLVMVLIIALASLFYLSIIFVQDKYDKIEQRQEVNISIGSKTNENLPKINLNTATKEQLMTLEGVGEDKANGIIAYKEQNGKFKTIYELLDITDENNRKVIGETTFNNIKDKVIVK